MLGLLIAMTYVAQVAGFALAAWAFWRLLHV